MSETDLDTPMPADTSEHVASASGKTAQAEWQIYLRHESSDRTRWRRAVRVRNGEVQTAVHTWAHQDGRRITLIGMQHYADPGFYEHVLRRIADEEQAGARVFYERVRPASEELMATWPADMAEGNRLLVQLDDAVNERGRWLGCDVQAEAFTRYVKPEWTMADISAEDVLLTCGPRRVALYLRVVLAVEHARASRRHDNHRARLRARRNMVRTQRFVSRLTVGGLGALDARVISDWRNIVAAKALLSVPPGGRAVGTWGARHLDGLGLTLHRNEFQLIDVQWLTAVGKQVPAVTARSHDTDTADNAAASEAAGTNPQSQTTHEEGQVQ